MQKINLQIHSRGLKLSFKKSADGGAGVLICCLGHYSQTFSILLRHPATVAVPYLPEAPRVVRRRRIRPPPPIFLRFWLLPSQFTSAATDFYFVGKKEKSRPFSSLSPLLFFEIFRRFVRAWKLEFRSVGIIKNWWNKKKGMHAVDTHSTWWRAINVAAA